MPLSPIAYSIDEVCELTGLGRTTVYEAIKDGALVSKKWGRRTIVTAEDLTKFIAGLPNGRSAVQPLQARSLDQKSSGVAAPSEIATELKRALLQRDMAAVDEALGAAADDATAARPAIAELRHFFQGGFEVRLEIKRKTRGRPRRCEQPDPRRKKVIAAANEGQPIKTIEGMSKSTAIRIRNDLNLCKKPRQPISPYVDRANKIRS